MEKNPTNVDSKTVKKPAGKNDINFVFNIGHTILNEKEKEIVMPPEESISIDRKDIDLEKDIIEIQAFDNAKLYEKQAYEK